METQETIIQFICEELLNRRATLKIDDNLLMDGLVDSLGMVRLVEFIEDRFDIHVPPEDFVIENFRSVTAITDYLNKHKAPGNGA